MGKNQFRSPLRVAVTVAGFLLAAPAVSVAASAPQSVSMPAMSLDRAVTELAAQTGLNVGGDAGLLRGKTSPPLDGSYTPTEALNLLLRGSGVTFEAVGDNAVTLRQATANGDSGATPLDPITVEGKTESAYGPVEGYRAERSATATKTDTPIRDIPNSIQVVPQQIIEDQQAITLQEVLSNAAGVTFLGIRGDIDLSFAIRGFDATILRDGLNIKGVTEIPTEPEMANLERVEVLRGPSVLYGQVDEPGGAINLVKKKPLDKPYYNFEFQAGNRGFVSPIVDLSGPVTEDGSLLYRVVALYRRENSFQDYDESFKRVFAAPSATWRPTRDTDLTVRLEYTRDREPRVLGLPAIGDSVADIPFDRVMNNPNEVVDEESLIAGYEAEHRFNESWKLRNKFSYVYASYDADVLTFPLSLNETTGELNRLFIDMVQEHHNFSTDSNLQGKFRTGPFDHTGLIGFDYSRLFRRVDQRAGFSPQFLTPIDIFDPDYFAVPVPNGGDLPPFSLSDQTRHQTGVYVQNQVDLLDNLILVAGLRYDDFRIKSKNLLTDTVTQDFDDTALTPRIGAVYRPIEPVSLYANYAESYFPNFSTDAGGNFLPPEEGEGFEVGVKIDLVPDRLSSTLAFYNITKKNVATADPVVPFASVATGEVRSRGFDADLTGEILPGWNVVAGYAYIDAMVTEDNNADRVGNELFGIPRHSANAWTTYEIQGGRFKGLGGGVGFNYVGQRQGDLANTFKLDGYVVTNAGLFYRWRNWQARLNVDNIFDVDYIEAATGSRTIGSLPGAPFTIRGSISATF